MPDVKGYTPLTDQQKELANEGKELEERVRRWLEKVAADPNTEKRCIALAVTNTQQAFMWAVRGIFKPERIALPEDTPNQPAGSTAQ